MTQTLIWPEIRFWSKAALTAAMRDFRYTPGSGHIPDIAGRQLLTKSGSRQAARGGLCKGQNDFAR
jgi:hypothetical protein